MSRARWTWSKESGEGARRPEFEGRQRLKWAREILWVLPVELAAGPALEEAPPGTRMPRVDLDPDSLV